MPEPAAGQTPALAIGQLEPSRLLRRAQPGHCEPSHVSRPKQSPPAGSRIWVGVGGFFLLCQDLAEIVCVLRKWVMFVQRFVNANRYASAQGCSRGWAGRASPVRMCRARCRPLTAALSWATQRPSLCGSFVTLQEIP